VEFKGLSGPIAFKEGDRSNIQLDIMRLGINGLRKVGTWTPDSRLNITLPAAFSETETTNVTLIVTTVAV